MSFRAKRGIALGFFPGGQKNKEGFLGQETCPRNDSAFLLRRVPTKRVPRLPARRHDTKSAPEGRIPRARNPFARPAFCIPRIHRGERTARWEDARAWAA